MLGCREGECRMVFFMTTLLACLGQPSGMGLLGNTMQHSILESLSSEERRAAMSAVLHRNIVRLILHKINTALFWTYSSTEATITVLPVAKLPDGEFPPCRDLWWKTRLLQCLSFVLRAKLFQVSRCASAPHLFLLTFRPCFSLVASTT
mgnify:CR=1 FL=1